MRRIGVDAWEGCEKEKVPVFEGVDNGKRLLYKRASTLIGGMFGFTMAAIRKRDGGQEEES